MSNIPRKRVSIGFDAVDKNGNPLPEVRSRTKQSFAEGVNINTIMKKVARTGLMPQRSGAYYGDFSDGLSYQESLAKINSANDAFMELPADIRSRFNNEPAELIDFLSDSKNKDEAVKLGLIKKPVATSPLPGGSPASTPGTPEPTQPPAANG